MSDAAASTSAPPPVPVGAESTAGVVEPSASGSASTAEQGQDAHPIEQAIQAAPQDVGHKVFVGNLPFSVTGESIKEIFAKVGTVTDAQIIHRGTRSLGYGFVTFTSESDAASAVSQLDKSEIAGRQVNVEVAKPMPAPGANGAAASAPRRAAKKAAQVAATKQTAQEANTSEGEETKKARKPRKARGPRTPRADDETEEAGDAPVSDAADALAGVSISDDQQKQTRASKRKPRARKDRKPGPAANADGELLEGAEAGEPPALGGRQGSGAGAANAAAGGSTRGRRGPPTTGVESSTLVFVGNLNFSVTNASLKEAFEPECRVKSAVVVVRKFGQSAGRSKGFAFVDFESNEDQQRALKDFQGKELEGRPMSIKVAIQPEEGHEAAEANKKAEKAAAAAAAKEDGAKIEKPSSTSGADAAAAASTTEQQQPQQHRTEGDAVIVAQ
ncbi:hypothetical protein JCM8202_000580 [Rhodotorula sphaerocarpa]